MKFVFFNATQSPLGLKLTILESQSEFIAYFLGGRDPNAAAAMAKTYPLV